MEINRIMEMNDEELMNIVNEVFAEYDDLFEELAAGNIVEEGEEMGGEDEPSSDSDYISDYTSDCSQDFS